MTPAELAQAWRARAEQLGGDIAVGYRSCVADLEAGVLDVTADGDSKEYKVSWWRQYSEPVRLSWWRRWLGQEQTSSIWVRHHCIVALTDAQIRAFAVAEPDQIPVIHSGWEGLNTALIVPLIHAGGAGQEHGVPASPFITAPPAIVGLQVEGDGAPTESIPCAEQPRNPPRCYTTHADRGDGKGPG